MYRVLLIDDEPIIRKGIKNIINWKQFDCDVCGEACDGLEGIELIRKFSPDIIITDICMPALDGLSMLKQIKSIVPNSKIIILTGYRDFNYVQDAIKFGAFDFLLKPTKLEELTSVLSKAVIELQNEKEMHKEIDRFKSLFEQSIPLLKEKLLYDLVFEINRNETEIIEKMKLYNIEITNYIFVVIENDVDEIQENNQYDKQLYQFGIVNSFEEILADNYHSFNIMLDSNSVGFIIKKPCGEVLNKDEVIEKCIYLQEMISNAFGFTVTIGVSTPGEKAMELPDKLKECKNALEYKTYIGTNSVIQFSDLTAFFKYDDYSILEGQQKHLLEGVKNGNVQLVKLSCQNIFKYLTSNSINESYLKNFFYSTLSSINNIRISVLAVDIEKKNEEGRDITSLMKLIEGNEYIDDLNVLLEEVAIKIANKVNSFNNKSIKKILRKAIDYIHQHYAEQVTLNEVSENIFVTTFYISRMFKQELGTSFIDYLNDVRIEKAKELLKDVKYKTYEVASLVGISDPHYFSKLFKKHSGMTPSEYREAITRVSTIL